MANLIRRRNEPEQRRELSPRGTYGGWDPFRLMSDLMRWDPFREMGGLGAGGLDFAPAVDVRETKDAYVITADLPGVKEEDCEVSVTQNTLTVSGRRQTEETQEGERYYTSERTFGEFHRTFTLPEGADPESATAEFKDGVLRVSIKKRPEVQPRRISLGKGGAPGAKA
jgi:HSP20 family protein